jgi:hypothetical protein
MLMTFVVVTFMAMSFMVMSFMIVASCSLSRVWLKVVFDGIRRTQRFAFHAPPAPIDLPLWRFPGRKPTVPACKPSK